MFTPLYAAILALLFVALGFRATLIRHASGIPFGDGGNPELARASRAHANFAEYVPLALILLYFLEQRIATGVSFHVLGCALISGRLLHAYGVSQSDEDLRFRVAGLVITLATIVSAAARILASYIS